MAEVHSIWNHDEGLDAHDRERIERIFLSRRADNQRGFGPTSERARSRRGLATMSEQTAQPAAPAEPATRPEPVQSASRSDKIFERRLSLEEMSRRMTGKGKRR